MARLLARLLGFALLIAAIALLVRDLALKSDTGLFIPVPLAQIWQGWWPASFDLAHALVERHLWAPVWNRLLAPALQLPAFLLLGSLGLLLLLASLPPRQRHQRRPRRVTPSRGLPQP
jgi:hypothetical protein